LAVALAVGSIVPDLADSLPRWPCRAIGVGFAVYGVALMAYGTTRGRSLDTALSQGETIPAHDRALTALTVAGIVLATATSVLIALA
jgi:uncharacterized membrane protein YidH (DUF202 family)